jgi:predicted small lipoprotein YifL
MKNIGMHLAVFISVFLLTGCGNEDSTPSDTDSGTIQISGAGIKGPLAFADARIFTFNPSFPSYYDNTSPISSAITNQSAEIHELSVPRNLPPPIYSPLTGAMPLT